MLSCFIRYRIDPFPHAAFEVCARRWGANILREERSFGSAVNGTLSGAMTLEGNAP